MHDIVQVLAQKGAVFAARAIVIAGAFFVAWLVASWARRAVLRSLEKTPVDATLSRFLANFLRYSIIVAALIACIGAMGFQTASFAALLGAAGIAIGLAFQSTLSNFAAGVMLLIFRPFRVGDSIRVAGQLGTVRELELFTTELVTADNRKIVLPNSAVFGQTLENLTHHGTRRAEVTVQMPIDADAEATEGALLAAVSKIPHALSEPPPEAVLTEIGVTAGWQLRVWCKTEDLADVQRDTARAAKLAVDAIRSRRAT
jgi:small conductance mechanosensitive channel